MNCEQALNLVAMDMAGELPADDRALLEAHLTGCAACRAAAEMWRRQEVELRAAFAPSRAAATALAERVITQVRTLPVPRRQPARLPWLIIPVFSAAAGFLLAIFVLPPKVIETRVEIPVFKDREIVKEVPAEHRDSKAEQSGSKTTAADVTKDQSAGAKLMAKSQPVAPHKALEQKACPAGSAELAVATGPVDVTSPEREKKKDAQDQLTAPAAIPFGCALRTPAQVRCEVRLPEGESVRLDAETEVVLLSDKQVELKRGQIWSCVTASKEAREPLQVHAGDAVIRSGDGQFDVKAGAKETLLTVLEGKVEITGGAKQAERFQVLKGQVARITGGQVGRVEQRPADQLYAATRWVNDFMAYKPSSDPEFTQRVQEILANSNGKTQAADEAELRRFGERCVPPLTVYLQSEQARNDAPQRKAAARLVCDLAPSWAIPDLIELLRNPDGDVRYYAASALNRLTGESQGIPLEQWRVAANDTKDKSFKKADKSPTSSEGYQAWKSWWEQNKLRYSSRSATSEQR